MGARRPSRWLGPCCGLCVASGKPVSFVVDEDSLFSASTSKKGRSKSGSHSNFDNIVALGSLPARGASYSCRKYTSRSERSASVGYSVAILDVSAWWYLQSCLGVCTRLSMAFTFSSTTVRPGSDCK